jgi:hypothetical protein
MNSSDAFVACSSPTARGSHRASCAPRTALARHFLKQLEPLGIEDRDLADFTPEHWWAWRGSVESRNRWPGQINIMRTLLRHCPESARPDAAAMAHRTSKPKRRLYGSYSRTEFARIRSVALKDVRAAEARVRRNTATSCRRTGRVSVQGRGHRLHERPPLGCGESPGPALPRGRLHVRSGYRKPASSVSELLGHPDVAPTNALFPTKLEIFSLMVLLVCDRGYNLSTLTSCRCRSSPARTPRAEGPDHPSGQAAAAFPTPLHPLTRRPRARSLELIMSMTETARAALREHGPPHRPAPHRGPPRTARPHTRRGLRHRRLHQRGHRARVVHPAQPGR